MSPEKINLNPDAHNWNQPCILELKEEKQKIYCYEDLFALYLVSLVKNQTFLLKSLPQLLEMKGKIYRIPSSERQSQAQKTGLSHPAVNHQILVDLFARLDRSSFRSSFVLRPKERDLLEKYGWTKTAGHAFDFAQEKLRPAFPARDGKQTPVKNHPVFIAAHATGTCCRGCLEKWHGIRRGQPLAPSQISYILTVQLAWLDRQVHKMGIKVKD